MDDDKVDSSGHRLGRFLIKDDDGSDSISAGSLFAHRKDVDIPRQIILKKTEDPAEIPPVLLKKKVGPVGREALKKKENGAPQKKDVDKDLARSKVDKMKGSMEKEAKATTSRENKVTQNSTLRRNGENSGKKKKKDRAESRKKPKLLGKPFDKLLEDVVLAISGYQNPYRGNLRTMALEMGARYKPDWDDTCTHLLCAFPNTPKFQQVWGKGHIVRKEWVENCYSKRKRLPWRRYALDKRDLCKPESEEEIPELTQDTSPSSRSSDDGISDSGSDTEDEIERMRTMNKQDDETDVESETELPDTSNLPLPQLPDVFTGQFFSLSDELSDEMKKKLKRYIVALNGELCDKLESDKVNFVISERRKETMCKTVRPDWVWECSDTGTVVPTGGYEVR